MVLGAAAALGWALAPAFSAQPYLPPAEDFSQTLPALDSVTGGPAARHLPERGPDHAEHPGEGHVTHRSAVIEAPARFDLAGIAGERRPYELRGREADGEWTDWVEVAAADPVWFGGAEELQIRARGWRPAGQLHYVNVSGDATEAGGILTAAREAVSSAVVAIDGVLGAEVAAGAPSAPAMISRRQWGANRANGGCRPRRRPDEGRVKAAAVHHTVSATQYTASEAKRMVLGICRFHRNGNGWDDIGYNTLVDRFGNLYVGRAGGQSRAVVGAQAQGFNAQTTGLASLGTHTRQPLSRRGMNAAARYLAWKLVTHGVTAEGRATLTSAGGSASRYGEGEKVRTKRVIGHRRVGLTECPGDELNSQLDTLRRKTQRKIDAAGGSKGGEGGGGVGSG